MKILYNSVHSILERDEISLLTELGHTVFSLGAYSNGGRGHYLLPRPSVEGMQEFPELEKMSREHPRNNLPQELFNEFDVIITMHMPQFLEGNWEKMKGKKVIFRSIGQSTSGVENAIRPFRYQGLKVMRMSEKERNIVGYVGEDMMIRFYGDPAEYGDWNGNEKRVMNLTQSLLGRRTFCHYDAITQMMQGFPSLVYGSGNEDLGLALNGGELPYDLMKGALRDNRVFVYGGTWPSPYSLSFIEALMTGIPVVAIGQRLAEDLPEIAMQDRINYYEIPEIIQNWENGFISDDINELRSYIHNLLEDHALAKRIGDAGRATAIKLFDKNLIKGQWNYFLNNL